MFTTADEMDRNARRWLAVLIPAVCAFSVIGLVLLTLISRGDDVLINLAKILSGR